MFEIDTFGRILTALTPLPLTFLWLFEKKVQNIIIGFTWKIIACSSNSSIFC